MLDVQQYLNNLRDLGIPHEDVRAALEQVYLNDFSHSLERELEKLVGMKEPVWTNDNTGKKASSICAAFWAIGFDTYKPWTTVCRLARKRASWHTRTDLPKNGHLPTACLDLADIEGLIIELAPRKGPKIIAEFKEEHGIKG